MKEKKTIFRKKSQKLISSNMKKKAEITTQQIVLLIVLLVSFIVLLFFLFKLNPKELSEKQICQSSIRLSGEKSFFSSIDCKINYLCISGGKGCEGFTPKNTIKVDLSAKDAKNQTMKAIADEMADCWWMFGEGKVNYMTKITTIGEKHCAACTEFAFDPSIVKIGTITKDEFNTYLKNTKKGDVQTYFGYLFTSFDEKTLTYFPTQIDYNKKYGVYTGRENPYTLASQQAIPVKILDRTESSSLGCSSFITTP
ncbi:MAG: hypothetical protein ABIH28_02880 [archaeon]